MAKHNTPSLGVQSFLSEALLDQAWSPDAVEITTKSLFVPVFLYGTEKSGYSEDLGKKGPPRVGVGHTVGPTFAMYKHQKEKYPIALLVPVGQQRAKVYGHIFLVSPDELFELDAKYQNNCYFKRFQRWVEYCSPEQRGSADAVKYQARCWMYVGITKAWQDKIESREITLLPKMTPKFGEPFYIFSNESPTPPM